MAYCGQCGSPLPEGTKFCPNCGISVAGVTMPPAPPASPLQEYWNNRSAAGAGPMHNVVENLEHRQQEEQYVQQMINYFALKQDRYEEYDFVNENLYQPRIRAHKALLIWGIILMVMPLALGSILLLIMLLTINRNETDLLILPLILFILALPGLFMILGYVHKNNHAKAACQNYENRFAKLTDELVQYYTDFGYCQIGFEFSNPIVLQAILNTIHGGRADTVKEAINILLESARRQNRRELSIQKVQSSRAAIIGANQPAAYSAATFFFR